MVDLEKITFHQSADGKRIYMAYGSKPLKVGKKEISGMTEVTDKREITGIMVNAVAKWMKENNFTDVKTECGTLVYEELE